MMSERYEFPTLFAADSQFLWIYSAMTMQTMVPGRQRPAFRHAKARREAPIPSAVWHGRWCYVAFKQKPLDLILRWLSFTINHHNSPWENYLQQPSIIPFVVVLWIYHYPSLVNWIQLVSSAFKSKQISSQCKESEMTSSVKFVVFFNVSIQTYSTRAPYSFCEGQPKVETTRDLFKHTANNIMLGILLPSLAFPSFAAAHHRALRPRKSCPCTIYLRGQVGMHNNGAWYGDGLKPMILYIVFGDEHPS